ncbi:MAG: hypothetical protein HRT89_10605 [Lentisphaeria bacterium]|nr:hypothetical protein [Lentisphaeria bacterium]
MPIPFADWSQYTEGYLPAVATGISFDLANIIFGMVMPFYAMVGSFIGLVVTFILNPLLFKFNQLPSWESGQQTLEINFNNTVDFYFSFSIGIALAVAIVGFWGMFKSSKIKRSDLEDKELEEKMAQRGDIPNKWILITYFASSIIYITLCGYLIEWHTGVMIVLFFFAFLYTPIISYVTARLEGLCGQVVEIPFIREVTFILSGYNGVAVWFIPTPKGNYGAQTVFYKQAELTGTKFTSIWKADVVLFPIIIISVVGFSSFIWSLADIPSYVYPYAQEMWEFEAKNQSIIYSSTLGEYSIFQDALSPIKIFFGFVAGLVSFIGLALVGSPTLLCYGIVRGLNQTMPHAVIPQFLGALLGRYYFEKKFGLKFRQYAPVLSAGYFCGAGLVAMLCIGFVFLAKSASSLLY